MAEDWAVALLLICFLKIKRLSSVNSLFRTGRAARLWEKAPRCSAGMSGGEQPQPCCALDVGDLVGESDAGGEDKGTAAGPDRRLLPSKRLGHHVRI